MADATTDKKDEAEDSTIKPEPETLHTTDPQEEMQGPISSLMQGAKESFENKEQSKEEADEEKRKDI